MSLMRTTDVGGPAALEASKAGGATRQPGPGRSWLRGPMLLLTFVLAALVAVYGALLVPDGPRVGGVLLSLGVVVAVVGNVTVTRAALRVGGKSGVLCAAAGWVVVALLAATRRANGSVVLPGSGDLATSSVAYLLGGSLACGLSALAGRSPTRAGLLRGWRG